MNIKERINAFWAGEKPDVIPYTIYSYELANMHNQEALNKLFEKGLGVTYHIPSTWDDCPVLEYRDDFYKENGHDIHRVTMKTDIGEIYCTYENGWNKKFYLETEDDYRIMTHIVKNTHPKQNYEYFNNTANSLGEYGIPLVQMGRSPLQKINVDFVGLENFALHLYDYEEQMQELYDALWENYKVTAQLVADGPGKFVSVLDNFTAETIGPSRYEKLLLPVYNDVFPLVQQSGKIIGTHYDGRLDSCKQIIKKAPMNLIESLTEPPEGDMTLDECRKCWPDKLFWSNLNVSRYNLEKPELEQCVYDFVKRGSLDGTKLAVEVSEHLPKNWETSMPIVLDTLNSIKF